MIDGSSLSHVFKGPYTGKSIVFVWMNGHVSSSRLGGIYGSSIQNATVHLPKDLGLLNLENSSVKKQIYSCQITDYTKSRSLWMKATPQICGCTKRFIYTSPQLLWGNTTNLRTSCFRDYLYAFRETLWLSLIRALCFIHICIFISLIYASPHS